MEVLIVGPVTSGSIECKHAVAYLPATLDDEQNGYVARDQLLYAL